MGKFRREVDGLGGQGRQGKTRLDLNDGVFFRAMEWSMVFEKKPLKPMVF